MVSQDEINELLSDVDTWIHKAESPEETLDRYLMVYVAMQEFDLKKKEG